MSPLHTLYCFIGTLFARNLVFRFIVIGICNTAFSYSVFVFFLYNGFSVELGSFLALALGIVFSFMTQGRLVFRHVSAAAFIRFLATWALIYGVNLGIVRSLMAVGLSSYASAAVATAMIVLLSFALQKLVVFRRPDPIRHYDTR
ncbi:MAG: GtrA family protein [Alphaproteobacteria bacterium]|nr:GtrA family protein [Alphaproteobacteria bacterium]